MGLLTEDLTVGRNSELAGKTLGEMRIRERTGVSIVGLKRSTTGMNETGSNNHVVEAELSRDLGLVSALAIGVGTMIAAGIFTLSGLAVGYVGSAAITSFLMAAVVATFTALTYCEFSSIYPQ